MIWLWLVLVLFVALIALSAGLNIRKRGLRRYVFNLLIGVDQFFNAVLGGAPDETISSRCGRGCGRYWYWTLLGKILNVIDPGHIQDAMANEEADAHRSA